MHGSSTSTARLLASLGTRRATALRILKGMLWLMGPRRVLIAPVELQRVMEDHGGNFVRQDWH